MQDVDSAPLLSPNSFIPAETISSTTVGDQEEPQGEAISIPGIMDTPGQE